MAGLLGVMHRVGVGISPSTFSYQCAGVKEVENGLNWVQKIKLEVWGHEERRGDNSGWGIGLVVRIV